MPTLIVVCDKQGQVDEALFSEVVQRFHADNPKYTRLEVPIKPFRLGPGEFQIRDLRDKYFHGGVLTGPCLEINDDVQNELKALSLAYPQLILGVEWHYASLDGLSDGHFMVQNGAISHAGHEGPDYFVPHVCSTTPYLFDSIVPRTLPQKLKAKVLRARKVISDVADMLQSDHFTGDDMREGGDKMKTARVTAQLRAASNALAILDGVDFDDVVADDIPDQAHFERSEKRIRDEETLNKQNETPLSDVREDDGIPIEWGDEGIMGQGHNL